MLERSGDCQRRPWQRCGSYAGKLARPLRKLYPAFSSLLMNLSHITFITLQFKASHSRTHAERRCPVLCTIARLNSNHRCYLSGTWAHRGTLYLLSKASDRQRSTGQRAFVLNLTGQVVGAAHLRNLCSRKAPRSKLGVIQEHLTCCKKFSLFRSSRFVTLAGRSAELPGAR